MDRARKTSGLSGGGTERPPLSRIIRIDDIKDGEERVIEVTPSERAAIAGLLDLVVLDQLSFTYRFYRRGEGRFVMQGTLVAYVTQTCVVSLEPMASALQVAVEIEFWPAPLVDQLAASADETASHGLVDWPEPIVEGKIGLGPIIYETLATALDPYPRREGVSFEWPGEAEAPGSEQARNPFAALAQLKPQ
jgi:uncharacterized metal-binding protein YceD (DUF177 family)